MISKYRLFAMTAILPMTIHVANRKAKTVFCANATKAAADKRVITFLLTMPSTLVVQIQHSVGCVCVCSNNNFRAK